MMGVYCVLYLLLRSETDHHTVEPRPPDRLGQGASSSLAHLHAHANVQQ